MKAGSKILLACLGLALVGTATVGIWVYNGGLRSKAIAHRALVDATVLTMDAQNSVAEALLLEGDRIAAVGTNEEILSLAPKGTPTTSLSGLTVMPGVIEAHGHFPGAGLAAIAVDLNAPPIGDITNLSALLGRIQQHMAANPEDDWVFGFGYDDTLLAEGRHPNREDLDSISSEVPIFLMHVSGHMGVGNSAALAQFDIDADTPDPTGGLIERETGSRRPSGVLYETAAVPLRTRSIDVSMAKKRAALRHATDLYTRAGITTVQNGLASETLIDGLTMAARLALVPQRIVILPDWETSEQIAKGALQVTEHPFLKLGATKLIADGSIQGYTAFLGEPYFRPAEHGPYGASDWRGEPTLDRNTLGEQIRSVFERKTQLAIHGNGDAAIDMILDAVEEASQAFPQENRRTILIHAQMMRPDQIARAIELDVTPSFFAAHVWYWGDRHRTTFLGPKRSARISPLAEAKARGLRFTTHLDTPVVPIDPWRSAAAAVERRTASGQQLGPEQAVSAVTALRSMTIDAAWQIYLEEELGSLEVGKYADLIVLDRNPLTTKDTLANVEILANVIGGVPAFEDPSFSFTD